MKTLHRQRAIALLLIIFFVTLGLVVMGSAKAMEQQEGEFQTAQEAPFGYALVTKNRNSFSFTATSDTGFFNPMIILLYVVNEEEVPVSGALNVSVNKSTEGEIIALLWDGWPSAATPNKPASHYTFGVTPRTTGMTIDVWNSGPIIIYSGMLYSPLEPPYSYTVSISYSLSAPPTPPFAKVE